MLNPDVQASKDPDIYSIMMTASHPCNESRCLNKDHIKRELRHQNLANSKSHRSAYQPQIADQPIEFRSTESSSSLFVQTAIQSTDENVSEKVCNFNV